MIAERESERAESDYQRHMRELEECATRLEDAALDPQEALAVYRQAQEHYQAVDAILGSVEDEIERIQKDRERSNDG